MFRRLSLFLIWVAFTSLGQGNTGLRFLTFGQLPRGTALGEAFTAVSDDLTSAGFNPAGLAGMDNIQFAFMHKAWFQDIYLNYGGMVLPVGRNIFNLGLTVNTTPGIELRDGATLEPLGTTDANDAALGFGWSREVGKVDLGLAGKFLYEKIHLYSASGLAFDLGVQYGHKEWRFGAAVLNWGPDLKFRQEKFSIPTQFRLGASYLFPRQFLQGSWLLAGDLVKPESFDPHLNLGVEYNYQSQFSARLGYKGGEQSQSHLSFGLGVKVKKYLVDYAFVPFKLDLGSSHQIALILEL